MAKKPTRKKSSKKQSANERVAGTISDLMKVYQDVERTLKGLRETAERTFGGENSLAHINLKKLINHLTDSKLDLEQKIGDTLLHEKQLLKRRLKTLASNLSH